MTAEILIVCPVLNRPQNARPLVESIAETASVDWWLLFVASEGDEKEINACDELSETNERVYLLEGGPSESGDYAKKINWAYSATSGDFGPLAFDASLVLLAADDLRFHAGWDTAALALFAETGAGVVGTNDLGHPLVKAGKHSTHPFVSRDYIDSVGGFVGGVGQVYYQGYSHNYVDCELVETAKARGMYAHCAESRIEHRHPLWDRSVAKDETYAKGRAGFQADRAIYESRRPLWERERVRA